MTPSPWLYDFLKRYERFRPTAFKPTKNDVWTIAWGHTHGVKEGDTCTYDQGEAWLAGDVAGAAVFVNAHCRVPLSQAQYDALVSLVFNIGGPAFRESTLLRKLNARDYAGASAEFPRWNKQARRVLAGLTERRAAERARFDSAVQPAAIA